MGPRAPLPDLISRLEALYGPPAPPAVTDPFAMVVWENASYLVDDDRRARVFTRLREEVGLDPEDILGTPTPVLVATIGDGGILPEQRAEKLGKAASTALEIGLDKLRELIRTAPKKVGKLPQ